MTSMYSLIQKNKEKGEKQMWEIFNNHKIQKNGEQEFLYYS